MATKLEELRNQPGMSNAGTYTNVAKGDFCGPHGTYPVNTIERGRSALKLAHNSDNPQKIKDCVYRKYPSLRQAQLGGAFGKPAYNNRGMRIPGMYE